MRLIDNKILLTDLAEELGVSNSALLQHLKNSSGLGVGAEKFGKARTSLYLLPIGSVLNYLNWMKSKAKHVKMEIILKVEEKIKCLKH